MESKDEFKIIGYFRFLLIIRALAPLFFMGITLWAVSTPYLELSAIGPLILIGLAVWAFFEARSLFKWYNFSLGISDQSLSVGSKDYNWDQIDSAWVQDAFQFQTYIQVTTKEGEEIKIPAVIQKNSFVRNALEKRITNFQIKAK